MTQTRPAGRQHAQSASCRACSETHVRYQVHASNPPNSTHTLALWTMHAANCCRLEFQGPPGQRTSCVPPPPNRTITLCVCKYQTTARQPCWCAAEACNHHRQRRAATQVVHQCGARQFQACMVAAENAAASQCAAAALAVLLLLPLHTQVSSQDTHTNSSAHGMTTRPAGTEGAGDTEYKTLRAQNQLPLGPCAVCGGRRSQVAEQGSSVVRGDRARDMHYLTSGN
jgi:hypothetical protein